MPDEDATAEPEERSRMLPAVRAHDAIVAQGEITVKDVVAQRAKIKEVMDAVMVEGTHYGLIPGVNKPSLFKPGAEVLNVTFRFAPSYKSERLFDADGIHLTVIARCILTHIPTGLVLGEGEGLCSTRESRYAYRVGTRVCPNCGADAIKKSKFSPREGDYPGAQGNDPPGWYCYAKVGGCGFNFAHDDAAITGQDTGKSDNPDIPDAWNTVLKMADKRALVAAILNCTAASDIFTQDVEDNAAAAAAEEAGGQESESQGSGGGSKPPAAAQPKPEGPASWDQWGAAMVKLGIPGPDIAEWMREPLAANPDRATSFVKAKKFLAVLEASTDVGTNPRFTIQSAIAAAFDGIAVTGPPWRITESEKDLPTREEHLKAAQAPASAPLPAPAAEEVATPAPAADGDDIPF